MAVPTASLGMPLGLLEVRCEHASPSGSQAHQAMELAIEFYNENCVECPYPDGTGELPNLATVATQRLLGTGVNHSAHSQSERNVLI